LAGATPCEAQKGDSGDGKGNPLKEQIVGKWKEVKGRESIEFTKDGKYVKEGGLLKENGEYKFVKDDLIHLTFGLGGQKVLLIRNVKIAGDELTLLFGESPLNKYKRVK
jgi:hypothetical protein